MKENLNNRVRTSDLRNYSPLLFQLSYVEIVTRAYCKKNYEDPILFQTHLPSVGLEPTTIRLKAVRSTN